ncbi:MAG: PIG-L deacetylase family protein [Actinomycetes bacterium]
MHRVLAVVAHPDDESFGLGGLLGQEASDGATTGVLCLTHGEASTLHGVEGDLHAVRDTELRDAAAELGVTWVRLTDHPDGALADVPTGSLDRDVEDAVAAFAPDVLLVFDDTGITGHPDHVAATAAAVRVAERRGLPVLAWTIPTAVAETLNAELGTAFVGVGSDVVDEVRPVDRDRQLRAVHAHPSQAVPGSAVWRRLELLGGHEHLRWLRAEHDSHR